MDQDCVILVLPYRSSPELEVLWFHEEGVPDNIGFNYCDPPHRHSFRNHPLLASNISTSLCCEAAATGSLDPPRGSYLLGWVVLRCQDRVVGNRPLASLVSRRSIFVYEDSSSSIARTCCRDPGIYEYRNKRSGSGFCHHNPMILLLALQVGGYHPC